jgi:hypothetical protein
MMGRPSILPSTRRDGLTEKNAVREPKGCPKVTDACIATGPGVLASTEADVDRHPWDAGCRSANSRRLCANIGDWRLPALRNGRCRAGSRADLCASRHRPVAIVAEFRPALPDVGRLISAGVLFERIDRLVR